MSFDFAGHLLDEMHKLKDIENVPIMLVANKLDLEDERVISSAGTSLSFLYLFIIFHVNFILLLFISCVFNSF